MKKLAAFIFGLLISLSFYADARLVSGTAQHQHDSATGGGATINNTSLGSNTKIAPSIYAYDSAAPTNEKYYKFGNASGDFVLFTYDDTPAVASTVFSITRTGTTPNSFDLGAVSLTSSKACASGYTRVSPNLCKRDLPVAVTNLSPGCTSVTIPASDTKAVLIYAETVAVSANVAGVNRFSQIEGSTGTDCTGFLLRATWISYAREFTAVAGTTLHTYYSQQWIYRTANFGINFTRDAGNASTAAYAIIAYMD